jgi:hypothetical protein
LVAGEKEMQKSVSGCNNQGRCVPQLGASSSHLSPSISATNIKRAAKIQINATGQFLGQLTALKYEIKLAIVFTINE